jgi:hypothetical protein
MDFSNNDQPQSEMDENEEEEEESSEFDVDEEEIREAVNKKVKNFRYQ